jgi:hypothetical protein
MAADIGPSLAKCFRVRGRCSARVELIRMARPSKTAAVAVTLGIDLASQPKNTALCAIDWEPRGARVISLVKGVTDDGMTPLDDTFLVSAMRGAGGAFPAPTKIAFDAPLGWPVDFVRAMRDPTSWPVPIGGGRERLERRATDHWVRKAAGKQPLSVTTDRIAYAAMRAAGILAHYATTFDEEIDRSGVTGLICEAYPDPAIRALGVWPPGAGLRESYKGAATGLREGILDRLTISAPWLVISADQRDACIQSDDCLDALICALVARAAELGLTVAPPEEMQADAAAEGWIHLPTSGSLGQLH